MFKSPDTIVIFDLILVKPLVWISFFLTIIEIQVGGGFGFMWSETIIASVFTVEFIMRFLHSLTGQYVSVNRTFPFLRISTFAVIDLIAILPFWLGAFLLPMEYVRMARVFRLLKYYRYSRNLQLNALVFYRAYDQIKGMIFQIFITSAFYTLMMYQAEHKKQPESFGNLLDSSYFSIVTSTTVGYGDRYPITIAGIIISIIMIPIIIVQMAAFVGIFAGVFDQIVQEGRDSDTDPIEMFTEEWERRHR